MKLTFLEYLSTIKEDVQQDVQKLMSDISMIDTQLAQRTQPLMAKKQQLQKMLAIKQKQAEAEQQRAGKQPQTQQTPNNNTKTPGGTGAGTPGSSTT